MSWESENTSDFERQDTIGKAMNSAPAMKGKDVTHEKMMEFEPLLEALRERNLRSTNLTHEECPCHCLAQTMWYPEHSNFDVLFIHGDEGSHEETSEEVSTVPGRDRAGSFQETLANPSQRDNHGLEKSWQSVSR